MLRRGIIEGWDGVWGMGDGCLWEGEEGGIVHIDGRVVDGIGQTGSHDKETFFGTVDLGGKYKGVDGKASSWFQSELLVKC